MNKAGMRRRVGGGRAVSVGRRVTGERIAKEYLIFSNTFMPHLHYFKRLYLN